MRKIETAKTLLEGYQNRSGQKFEFLPGENLLIDSFFSRASHWYIAFITNKRIILKLSNLQGGRGSNLTRPFRIQIRFIKWSEVSEIFYDGYYLRIEGEYSYFTPSGKSGKEPESPFRGTLESSSGLNRLSFQNNDELLKAILPVISSIAKSNDINFGTIVSNKQGDNFYQFSNLSEEKNKEMIEKYDTGPAPHWLLYIIIYLPIVTIVWFIGTMLFGDLVGGYFAITTIILLIILDILLRRHIKEASGSKK